MESVSDAFTLKNPPWNDSSCISKLLVPAQIGFSLIEAPKAVLTRGAKHAITFIQMNYCADCPGVLLFRRVLGNLPSRRTVTNVTFLVVIQTRKLLSRRLFLYFSIL